MAKKDKTEGARVQAVNANVLVQLVKSKAENKAKIGEINGELSASIKHHVELSGLRKLPFNFICSLDSKSVQEREADHTAYLMMYDMMVEKNVWQAHVGDLATMAEQASGDGHHGTSDDEQEEEVRPPHLIEQERQRLEEERQVASNVTQLQRGIRPVEGDAAGTYAVN